MNKVQKRLAPSRKTPDRRCKLDNYFSRPADQVTSKRSSKETDASSGSKKRQSPQRKNYNTRSSNQTHFEKGELVRPKNKKKKAVQLPPSQSKQDVKVEETRILTSQRYERLIEPIVAGIASRLPGTERIQSISHSFFHNCCVGLQSIHEPLLGKKYAPAQKNHCLPDFEADQIHGFLAPFKGEKHKHKQTALFIKHSPGSFAHSTVAKVCEKDGFKPIIINIDQKRVGRTLFDKLYESTQSRCIASVFFTTPSFRTALIFKNTHMALQDDQNFLPTIGKLLTETKAPTILMGESFVKITGTEDIGQLEFREREEHFEEVVSLVFGVVIFEILSSLIPVQHKDSLQENLTTAVDEIKRFSFEELHALQKLSRNLVIHHRAYYTKCLSDITKFAFALRQLPSHKRIAILKKDLKEVARLGFQEEGQTGSVSYQSTLNIFLSHFASFDLPTPTLLKNYQIQSDSLSDLALFQKRSERLSSAVQQLAALQDNEEQS